ncbi:MAG: ABC transporter ATP-binding protein [Dissulfurispiraceae bacterium]|jgi:ATP-binding cassette, subfamily B, bacterial
MTKKQYSWIEFLKELHIFTVPYKRTIVLVMVFMMLAIAADLMEPVIYKVVINDLAGMFVHKAAQHFTPAENLLQESLKPHTKYTVMPRTAVQAFHTLIIGVLLLFLVNLLYRFFNLLSDYLSAQYSSKVEQDFILAVFRHVLKLKLSFFTRNTSASLAKQIDQTDQVGPAVTTIVQDLASESFRLVGTLGIMLSQHPVFTAISLSTLPLYAVLSRRMAKKLEGTSAQYFEQWDDVANNLQNSLVNIKTVKVSGAEVRMAARFVASMQHVMSNYLSRNRIENIYIFWQTFSIHLGKFLVFAYGSWQVIERQLTPGDVVMFAALLDKLYDPIDTLTSHFITLQNQRISISRGLRLLHAGEEESPGQSCLQGPGLVEYRHVTFGYEPLSPVINDFNLTLAPHSITALIGQSGAGKTTILDLLLKFYEPQSGEILIDGQSLSRLDPASVRQLVGIVSADGAVFKGTLRDNIVFKNQDARTDEIVRAVKDAGLTRTVERLPQGLDTEIGEQGIGLSLGERQRLQIARILVAQPRFLLLDEATANLDYAIELEIKETLARLKETTTILIVAHRYSMVKGVDQVVVLDRGRVLAAGTHDEVYAHNDWFRTMVDQGRGEE